MSGELREAIEEAIESVHGPLSRLTLDIDAMAAAVLAKPQMQAIKSFLLRYAETQSAATAGNWNDSPRDVLEAVLGDEGQSVIGWVLDEEDHRC